MAWNLDDAGAPAAATDPENAARPATIFEDPEGRPDPRDPAERLTRLEKKLNGALYLLRRADAERRNRRAVMSLLFFAGLAAVGYTFWPQLRDADWGAAKDLGAQGVEAFRERKLGEFLAERFGDTALGAALGLPSPAAETEKAAAEAREARHRQAAARAAAVSAQAAARTAAVSAPASASGASALAATGAAPALPSPRPRRP